MALPYWYIEIDLPFSSSYAQVPLQGTMGLRRDNTKVNYYTNKN